MNEIGLLRTELISRLRKAEEENEILLAKLISKTGLNLMESEIYRRNGYSIINYKEIIKLIDSITN